MTQTATYRSIRERELKIQAQSQSPALEMESDLQVLGRYAAWNDPEAFAEIVRRHAPFVFATCLRVLGDQARAEDASQETFLRLMRRPHEINQSLGAWLHRTATHLSVDALRSDTARHRREMNYHSTRDHEASSWSELSPAVDQALSELPDEFRVLMVQHFLQGKSQAQLAEDTGQSPATICRRIKQGLEALRQHLRLKGIYAAPAALAGLLLHAAARQAPAGLMRELGKMAMLSGAGAAGHGAQASSIAKSSLLKTFGLSGMQSRLLLILAGLVSAILMAQLMSGGWHARLLAPSPQEMRPDDAPRQHKSSNAGIAGVGRFEESGSVCRL